MRRGLKGNRVMLVHVDGLAIEGADTARSYLEALGSGSAEPFTASLFRRAVRPGTVVVDIGAFLGQYTLLAAREAGPTGRVYAFEPDPRNFAYLIKNIERNEFADRASAIPQAISDRSGEITLYLDPDVGSGSSLVFRRRRNVTSTTVQTVTLDEFLGEAIPPDLIKLDIEGGECRALDGMTETIRRAGDRLTMIVECFPKALRASGASTDALIRRLERFGFRVYVIDEGRRRLFPITARRSSIWSFYLYLGLHSLLVVNLLAVRTPDHPLVASLSHEPLRLRNPDPDPPL